MTELAKRVRQTRVNYHHSQDHHLVYKEFGTKYHEILVEGTPGDLTITVMPSDYMDIERSGIFCIDCEKYVGSREAVDDWQ